MPQFSDPDLKQIHEHKLTVQEIQNQLDKFVNGFPFSPIVSAATLNNGVFPMLNAGYADIYENNRHKYTITKFVPASGAATRMFRDLYEYLSSGTMNPTTQTVLDNLTQFAFYDDLTQILPDNATPHDIIAHIVTDCGLNYGNLPKALLKFHCYPDGNRTALAEHLAEGAQYAESNGIVNIHFTVSPEHQSGFDKLLDELVPEYEAHFGVKYNITTSNQHPETDTIAVNPDNTPFRTNDGKLLFRPAGHGALIANLNDIESDIIFIKNIDNVCPEHARGDTILHKKLLAGAAIQIQSEIFRHLTALDNGTADIDAIKRFITDKLCVKMTDTSDVRSILNRPLRVCGIIKNTGEPGGGPFWVRNPDGCISLQIVEPAQISPDNISILHDGEYFSPTDLVCMPYDYTGKKFDLTQYIDETTGFISSKSSNGRPLRAMERPGLWNGAMAHWNTVFIETPLSTFTPVKVVTDLIKPSHK